MAGYVELTNENFDATVASGVTMVDFGLHGVDLVE